MIDEDKQVLVVGGARPGIRTLNAAMAKALIEAAHTEVKALADRSDLQDYDQGMIGRKRKKPKKRRLKRKPGGRL